MPDLNNLKPDIEFRMDKADVSRITEADLKKIRQMIGEFAKAKQNLEEAGSRNTWKSNAAEPDQDKKQDVAAIVDGVIETIEAYFRTAAAFREKVPFNLDISLSVFK